jgi:hypothetical protein
MRFGPATQRSFDQRSDQANETDSQYRSVYGQAISSSREFGHGSTDRLLHEQAARGKPAVASGFEEPASKVLLNPIDVTADRGLCDPEPLCGADLAAGLYECQERVQVLEAEHLGIRGWVCKLGHTGICAVRGGACASRPMHF